MKYHKEILCDLCLRRSFPYPFNLQSLQWDLYYVWEKRLMQVYTKLKCKILRYNPCGARFLEKRNGRRMTNLRA
jgi:hypothetical protein